MSQNSIKYWTRKEEDDLCHAVKLKRSFERIALEHGRSVKAIEMRLHSIFKKKMEQGETMKTLQDEFRMTETQLKNIVTMEAPQRNSSPMDITKISEKLDKIETILLKIYKHVKTEK